jgi:hypothetical protein
MEIEAASSRASSPRCAAHRAYGTNPVGELAVDLKVSISIRREALLRLADNLDYYVRLEPRLRSAVWVYGDSPKNGAEAEIVADVPRSLAYLHALIGDPRAQIRITEWCPPSRVQVRINLSKFYAWGDITLMETSRGCIVHIRGAVKPRSRLVGSLLAPIKPQLELVAETAAARGVCRAAAAASHFALATSMRR